MDRCCGNCRWYAITLNRKRGGTIGECEFPLPDAAEICDTSLNDTDGVNCPCFAAKGEAEPSAAIMALCAAALRKGPDANYHESKLATEVLTLLGVKSLSEVP